MLFQKVASAFRLLRHHPEPWKALRRQAKRNQRAFRLWCSGERAFRYQLDPGIPFACDPQDVLSRQKFLGGEGERQEIEIIQHWVEPGDWVIDGGCNLGVYAAAFAQSTQPEGGVLAFEPDPQTAGKARWHLEQAGLDGVQVLEVALGRQSARALFSVESSGEHSYSHHLQSQHGPPDARFDAAITVEVMSIDQVLNLHLPAKATLSYIKLDLEGAEVMALQGARAVLESAAPPAFQMELSPGGFERFGVEYADVERCFSPERFDGWAIGRDHQHHNPHVDIAWDKLVPLLPTWSKRYRCFCNAIFFPKVGPLALRQRKLAKYLA